MAFDLNKLAKLGPLLGALTAIGLIQGPLLVNIQLLIRKPELFPVTHLPGAGEVALVFAATGYLIYRGDRFRSAEWRIGAAAMALPYVVLSWIGLYYDVTAYLIADAEGRRIGGGASMAHVPLVLYSMGPAQLVSALGFELSKKIRKRKPAKDPLH
jgi:hypothetical protein